MAADPVDVAIIGDHFMLPERFADAIAASCEGRAATRSLTLPWPDKPMEHGYAKPGMDGLREYQGDPDAVVAFVGNAPVLVTQLAPVSAGMLDRLPALRLIAVSRGGPVNVDLVAARARGVLVCNTPGRNASAVAEFTIGAILAQTRLITAGHDALRAGEWRGDLYRADRTGRELSELVVGVVGYGQIGTRVVKLLRAFGCRVLVHDPYTQLSATDANAGVTQTSLTALLSQADVVTLHPRVTAETTGMIGAAEFRAMRPGAVFINTARGPLVDYDALYDALRSGHLAGAAIETFAVEPVPADWPLLRLPNVTLTPHIAGASVRTVTVAAEAAAEEVRRWIAGEPPLHPLLGAIAMDEHALRTEIVQAACGMNALGINQGTSGNVSARCGARMLITPSATAYEAMRPEDVASMPLEGERGAWTGPLKPSTEWRFHLDILRGRPDAGAVVHTHATYCTTLAILRRPIPAVHYMMAAFGGTDVRCAPYATFGTGELATHTLAALEGRNACLLANHGMVVVGASLAKAMWLAVELETIARQYCLSLQLGSPHILSDAEIAATAESFSTYGLQERDQAA